MIKIRTGKVGRNAYKVSKSWRLGVHFFSDSHGNKTLRLVYLRTKKCTYYIDLNIECSQKFYDQEGIK